MEIETEEERRQREADYAERLKRQRAAREEDDKRRRASDVDPDTEASDDADEPTTRVLPPKKRELPPASKKRDRAAADVPSIAPAAEPQEEDEMGYVQHALAQGFFAFDARVLPAMRRVAAARAAAEQWYFVHEDVARVLTLDNDQQLLTQFSLAMPTAPALDSAIVDELRAANYAAVTTPHITLPLPASDGAWTGVDVDVDRPLHADMLKDVPVAQLRYWLFQLLFTWAGLERVGLAQHFGLTDVRLRSMEHAPAGAAALEWMYALADDRFVVIPPLVRLQTAVVAVAPTCYRPQTDAARATLRQWVEPHGHTGGALEALYAALLKDDAVSYAELAGLAAGEWMRTGDELDAEEEVDPARVGLNVLIGTLV